MSSLHELETKSRSRRKIKTIAFAIFDSKCAVCGITDERVLQVDHKNRPTGTQYRKNRNVHLGGHRLYTKLANGNEDSSNYQLLCANHNKIKQVEQHEYTSKTKFQSPQAMNASKSESHKDV
jgi:hypothetical protein